MDGGVNVEVRKEFEGEGGSATMARQVVMPEAPVAGLLLAFGKERPDPEKVYAVLYDVEGGWYYAFLEPETNYDLEWSELERQAIQQGWGPVESEYPYCPE